MSSDIHLHKPIAEAQNPRFIGNDHKTLTTQRKTRATSEAIAAEMYLASLLTVDSQNFMEKSYLDELTQQVNQVIGPHGRSREIF